MAFTRRALLRAASAGLAGGVAGCASAWTGASRESDASPTDAPGGPLTFSARIVAQPSLASPARVEARLTNTGEDTVEVGFGPALLFTDDAGGDLQWAEDLVLDPETDVGPWDEPERTPFGCLRFPDDGRRLVRSSLAWRTLAPGDALTETYRVYTGADAEKCLPAGTYRFQDRGSFETESRPLLLTLVVTVEGDRSLSASTEGAVVGTPGP